MKDWNVQFLHKPQEISEDGTALAWAEVNTRDNYAILNLNLLWFEDKELKSDYVIKMIAFHECLEIMLAGLEDLARERYITEELITLERHKIINRLENSIFKTMTRPDPPPA